MDSVNGRFCRNSRTPSAVTVPSPQIPYLHFMGHFWELRRFPDQPYGVLIILVTTSISGRRRETEGSRAIVQGTGRHLVHSSPESHHHNTLVEVQKERLGSIQFVPITEIRITRVSTLPLKE